MGARAAEIGGGDAAGGRGGAGAGARGDAAGADALVWYRCPDCKTKMEGFFTRKTIEDHEAVHRAEKEKARKAMEQREADRQRQAAAQGKKPGKAKSKQAARDKRFGK